VISSSNDDGNFLVIDGEPSFMYNETVYSFSPLGYGQVVVGSFLDTFTKFQVALTRKLGNKVNFYLKKYNLDIK
jgi:hypothetical protein